MNRKIEASLNYTGYGDKFELRIFDRISKAVAQPVTFDANISDGMYIEPTLSLTQDELQGLFDELSRAGFKPSRQENAAAALKATQDHLGDMRQIAFGLLNQAGVTADGKGGAA